MSMLKKLAVALVVSGEFFAGSVKGEVWKTPWRVDVQGTMRESNSGKLFYTKNSKGKQTGNSYSFDGFLKYLLNDKGCYKGNDWADIQNAEALLNIGRMKIEGNEVTNKGGIVFQLPGFAYLINKTTGEGTPVFFGVKQKPEDNSNIGGHNEYNYLTPSVFKTSVYDHTERQLINACFADFLERKGTISNDQAFKTKRSETYSKVLERDDKISDKYFVKSSMLENIIVPFVGDGAVTFYNMLEPNAVDMDQLKENLGTQNEYLLRVHTHQVPCGIYDCSNYFVSCCSAYGHLLYDLRDANLNIKLSYKSDEAISRYCSSIEFPSDPNEPINQRTDHFYNGSTVEDFVQRLYKECFQNNNEVLTDFLDGDGKHEFYRWFLKAITARAYMCDTKLPNLNKGTVLAIQNDIIACVKLLRLGNQNNILLTEDQRDIIKVMDKIDIYKI